MKAHVLKTLFALSISCLLLPALSEAQSTTKSILGSTPRTLHRVIKWENHTKDGNLLAFGFEGASYDANRLPVWVERFAVPSFGVVRATVRSVRYEAVKTLPVWWTDRIAETLPKGADVATVTEVRNARRTMTGEVRTTMLRRTAAGQLERAIEVDIDVAFEAQPSPQMRQNFVTQSELSDGTIYKVAVTDAGVYKLDYNFLKNTLGISNLDAIDPRRIRVLAGDAGILPERNNISRTDDLAECAAYISGESDGKFDTGDYLLFYARGASVWNFASDAKEFNYTTNPYADRNYYFIKIDDSQTGKRAASRASLATTIQTTNSGDVFAHYEKDEVNIMRRAGDGGNGLGTGRDFWEKDYFKYNNSRAYSFVFPNLVATEPVRVTSRVAAHCYVDGASFTVQANGVTLATHNIPRSITNISAESQYAYDSRLSPSYTPAIGGGTINVQLTFNRPDYSAIGWLDYIELQGRAALNCSGVSAAQVAFRDSRTVGAGNSTTFQLSNLAGATLWDVTDPFNVQAQGTDASGNSFGVETSILREFVAFNPSNLPAPVAVGRVSSQNLHALAVPDMVILTHSAFRQQAEQLAAHRRTQSALEVAVVDVNEVYNEFASGRKDITAIRDFARMLYTRDAKFHYLLFMGDASFDYRGRYGDNDFIPTYETPASLDDVTAYATDDFFALLDPSEGASPAYGGLDIAVGRLPVNNSAEASDAVGKIIHYDTSPDMLGEWVNRLTFVADNPDIYTGSFDNEHEQYADATAVRNNQRYVRYNQDKIYLDSYELISGAAGGRFPDANAAINQAMFKGSLVMNYVGHGGPEGWADRKSVV